MLNRGVNGERSDQIRERFDRDVLARRVPRSSIIIAGVNDVYQGRSAESVRRNFREIYERAANAHVTVVAGSIIPYNTASPDQNARMREINAWIRRIADQEPGIWFCDTRGAVAAPANPDLLASSPDGLHPDVAGYRRMAEALRPVIETALKEG